MSKFPQDDGRQSIEASITVAPAPIEANAAPATTVLFFGAIAYCLLCLPAIGQRGYPPIDPGWAAVIYIWIVPLVLAAVVDPRPLGNRLTSFVLYCFVTGFVDAATVVLTSPRHVDLIGTLQLTIFVGPIHLVIGLMVAIPIDGVARLTRHFARNADPGFAARARRCTAGGILIVTVAFPFTYREYIIREAIHLGIDRAQSDWNAGKALRFADHYDGDGTIEHEFDPLTGFRLMHARRPNDSWQAYNGRIDELLREQGNPEWSMKRYMVADELLIDLLDSDDLREIDSFPYEVNENIIVFRQGNVARWGKVVGNADESLSIASKMSGHLDSGNKTDSAFVCELTGHPGVFFIRCGTKWLWAFHESGVLLSTARRF